MSPLLSPSNWKSPAGMLRVHKIVQCQVCILTLLSSVMVGLVQADDEQIPSGFQADRYQKVWERNPFTLVTPVAQVAQVTAFDKLILVSWLKQGSKDLVLVQNTETSEVQKVTSEPNANNLRLVEIHPNPNPQMVEAVLSSGKEQGPVKFKMDVTAAGQQPNAQTGPAIPNVIPPPGQAPVQTPPQMPVQPPAGMSQESEGAMRPNPAQAQQQQAPQDAVDPRTAPAGRVPVRPGELRRKRLMPTTSN
jgi:hypothetical protein